MPVRREHFFFGMRVTSTVRRPPGDGFEPAYLALQRSGELAERARAASGSLENCDLCARYCHVNRKLSLEGAACRTGETPAVSSVRPHYGEEDCLRGWRGAGAIFFSRGSVRSDLCEIWDSTWMRQEHALDAEELADAMLGLQAMGCHNIILANASHVVAQALAAITIAAQEGLYLPVVFNSGGYDSMEALRLLDGVVDIYMPDMKYGDPEAAGRYSGTPDYVDVNRTAVREMHRQVGNLRVNRSGIAERGLLVRHLVLPRNIAGTARAMRFLADEVSPDTYVHIMDQYRPAPAAREYPELDRMVTAMEYAEAIEAARASGLYRIELRYSDRWVIKWP